MQLFSYTKTAVVVVILLSQRILASPIVSSNSDLFNTSISTYELERRGTPSWKPDYVLHITSEPITLSCQKQTLVLVNGQHPGPLLRFQEGKTTWVRVYNHLEETKEVDLTEIAIHWHGIDVENWHDGTPENQRTIAPGFFRDYAVTPPYKSAGSYLYHDHAMSFAAASATGPIIVDPATQDNPYPYDERIIFLSDVFHKSDAEIEKGLTGFPFKFSGEARSILVNGKGYGVETRYYPGLDENQLNPPPHKDTCEIEVLRVTVGKSYRLRFISGTAMTTTTFAIKHDATKSSVQPLQVIEADGEYTQPYYTDRITIASGQRYSVLLSTSTIEAYRTEGGFWLEGREVNRKGDRGPTAIWIEVEDPDNPNHLKTVPMNGGFERDTNANKVITEADKARQPGEEPPTEYESFSGIKFDLDVLKDMPLKPRDRYDIPTSDEVTATITLRARDISKATEDQLGYPQYEVHWNLGEKPYYGPPHGMPPRLVAMATDQTRYCPNPAAYDPLKEPSHYDAENNIYAVEKGAVLDIILLNMPPPGAQSWGLFGASDSHPFHLHGAHYYDLGHGEGGYDDCVVEDNIANNRVLKRDTSMLYYHANAATVDSPDGWRAMRIKVESLGVWLLHCHMLQHMLMGMGIALAFGTPKDIQALPKPKLKGWGSDKAQNVFYERARDGDKPVDVGKSFSQIPKQGERLGEPLTQGDFGVKADSQS